MSTDGLRVHVARLLIPAMAGLLLLGPRPAIALDPAKAVGQYSLAAWQTEDGLPHNLVQAIAQTPDGYVWLATQEGLARFDGVRFTVFDRRSTAAMSANDVETIYVCRDGSLWVGVYGGTLLRYQNGRFRSYSSREGLSSATITALAEDTHGDLWIGTDGDGLYRLHDGVFTRYTEKDGLIDDSVRCLLADREGNIWIGTPSGLGRKRADGIESYALPPRERPVTVSALAATTRADCGSAPRARGSITSRRAASFARASSCVTTTFGGSWPTAGEVSGSGPTGVSTACRTAGWTSSPARTGCRPIRSVPSSRTAREACG